jgi:Spy/CpxP family protein refolding chaperone
MLNNRSRTLDVVLATLLGALALAAQPPQGGGPGQGPGGRRGGGPGEPNRPPVERMFGGVPPGRWWTDPAMVQRLALSADQQKQIENMFQSSRAKLIDLNASLQKEEVVLEPLLDADPPDEAKIVPQIDRVAQARAELEKANARMLLGFRGVLNKEQWSKLQSQRPGLQPGRDNPPPPRNGGR